MNGKIYLVGAGPGEPSLITVRGIEILRRAEVVLYDRLVHPTLLDYASEALHIYVGKKNHLTRCDQQEHINRLMISHAQKGKRVVRLKGGDPFIFGRGGEEAIALRQAGIDLEVVPGVSSALAVPSSAGIPLTHRGVASAFAVFTGHKAQDGSSKGIDWELAARVPTAVFLMGIKELPLIVAQLLAKGRPADTPVAVIEQGTLPGQRVVAAKLADVLEKAIEVRPPATIVVGEVVRLGAVINPAEINLGELPPSSYATTLWEEIEASPNVVAIS